MGLKTSFDRSELPQDLAAITHFPPVSDHLTPPAQQANSHYTPFPLTTRKIILSDETLGEAARFEMLASRYDCIIGSSPYINSLVRIVSRINGIFLAAREGKQASYQLCCYNDFLNESPPPTTNKGTVGISRLESFGLNEINRDVFNASRCACQMANIETKLLDSGLPSTITPSFILSLHSTLSAIYSPGVSAGLRNHDLILLCRLWARRRTPHRLNWATSRRSPCIGAFSGCALPDPTRTPPFPSCRGEGSSSPRRGRGSRRAWCGRTPCGSRGTGAADSRAG